MIKIHISRPVTAEEFEQYYDLRWRILRAPWNKPRGSEKDELEESAEHLIACDVDGKLIGVGRIHYMSKDQAQVRYMAVEENLRGQGVGDAIYRQLESLALYSSVKCITVNARMNAVEFYQRMGFNIVSDGHTLFDEIQHKVMEKEL